MKRRIFTFLLALVLTFGVLPPTVFSAGYTTNAQVTCPSCGLANGDIVWTAWEGETTIADDRHLQLKKDVSLTEQITVTGNLLLDLNGYTLTAAKQDRAFYVSGGTLTVIDSSAEGGGAIKGGDVSSNGATDNANAGGAIYVNSNGALNLYSGTVKGGYAVTGGNIHCAKGTTLNIYGGVVRDGYAVAIDGSTGRGGNIYTSATTVISGNAQILNGIAQYGTGNSGRGGNLFVHNNCQTVIKGNAIVAGGYAGYRGGNILINYASTLTIQEKAEIYGGTARKYANNVDVMTSTLNMEGGTIYGSPAGGCKTNIIVYNTSSVFNITGGKIYGRVEALAGMTINISGKPYVEHLYLPCTIENGEETARALITPGTFEEGAWVGLEVQAEDQTFTGPLEDFSSYLYFFHYDKQGLTWYHRKTDNALYLTTGNPCSCCGEDVAPTDIEWIDLSSFERVENPTLTPGHYVLTGNVNVDDWEYPSPITVDGVEGYVTLNLNGFTLTGSGISETFEILPGSTFNIVDNWVKQYHDGISAEDATQGVLKGNGTRAIKAAGAGTTVNIYGGIITGNVKGDNNYGGTARISDSAVLNIYGGALENGTSEDHAGNIHITGGATVNLYGGTISGGTVTGGTDAEGAFSGNGGNIYITGRGTTLNIYGGAITGGKNLVSSGGNIMVNSGADVYMYDGVIEDGGAKKYGANIYVNGSTGSGDNVKYSRFYMYGGSFGAVNTEIANINGISRGNTNHPIKIYNGTVYTTQNVSAYVGDCACYRVEEDATYFWNYGHNEKVCDVTCHVEEAWGKGYIKALNTGVHDYVVSGSKCTCAVCGYSFAANDLAAVSGGRVYESLTDALKKADQDSAVTLLGNVTEDEIAVTNNVTLDLNGFTLTANAFTSVGGNIVDTSGGDGLLVCDSVSLADENAHLPVAFSEGLRFSSITPDHTLERLDNDTVRIRFTFRERSYDTRLDDWIKAGNKDIQVQLYLTWTDSAGKTKSMTYVCDHSLLVKYAEKWNSRRYVATITSVSDVKDLTCTVQVSSTAASGVTVAATTLKNVAYINQTLSWEAINSYPLKEKDWTVQEMRQHCVEFMEFTKTYLWTPDETVNYIRNASGSADTMSQGEVYGGLPYVGVASGNCYRMMDYIDPETGLLDMEKALPALAYKDSLTMADLKYFGSQCSIAVYWAWGRVMNSADYQWTASVVPKNDFIILGDIQVPDIDSWSLAYNTKACIADNGEQTMYEGYAQLQMADGLVYWTTAGHLVMAYTDAHVVRKSDGTIDGDKSYIYLIDQGQSWKTLTNEEGDTFKHKDGINEKYTFKKLMSNGYIPFTFKEFLGEASIEDTMVHLVKDGTYLVSGTIRESDRAYVTTKTTDTLAWDDIFTSRVRSNYGVVDVYVSLYNTAGEEFYRHAVRTGTAGNKNLAMAESGAEVTIWQYANVAKNRSYDGKIEVQLATGERVVIFDGTITT